MDLTVPFKSIACCVSTCGIIWAVPSWYYDKKREDHLFFYCPNGHKQYFPEKSDLENLQERLKNTESKLEKLQICAETKKRRISSLKGVITKMKRRD